MANLIDEMEARIFAAQLARLSRITGRTVDGAFISEMYKQVKARYLEELKKRKIRLRELDGARLDEIVSYIFYYHISLSSKNFISKLRLFSFNVTVQSLLSHIILTAAVRTSIFPAPSITYAI